MKQCQGTFDSTFDLCTKNTLWCTPTHFWQELWMSHMFPVHLTKHLGSLLRLIKLQRGDDVTSWLLRSKHTKLLLLLANVSICPVTCPVLGRGLRQIKTLQCILSLHKGDGLILQRKVPEFSFRLRSVHRRDPNLNATPSPSRGDSNVPRERFCGRQQMLNVC